MSGLCRVACQPCGYGQPGRCGYGYCRRWPRCSILDVGNCAYRLGKCLHREYARTIIQASHRGLFYRRSCILYPARIEVSMDGCAVQCADYPHVRLCFQHSAEQHALRGRRECLWHKPRIYRHRHYRDDAHHHLRWHTAHRKG